MRGMVLGILGISILEETQMIVFEFELETHNSDGTLKERPTYWLGGTSITKEDEEHSDEIYEQINAHEAFFDEE
jgi:hypothetical protein